jgi:hypothetical protein
MSRRQETEGDPEWYANTHCCFCKRATRMFNLKTINEKGEWNEQCYGCERKGIRIVPEKEELFELRKSQKRNYYQHFEDSRRNKRSDTPPARNVYAKGPTYKTTRRSEKNEEVIQQTNNNTQETIKTKNTPEETIDWINDSEETILRKAKLDKGKSTNKRTWREIERDERTPYCTKQCQFMDHKPLKDGTIHLFDANTTMIHDRRSCPYGTVEYDEAGFEYNNCTCYRKESKYCFEHDHKTNPCNCPPQVFWEVKSFAGSKCKWEGCMYYDEIMHCEHLYCWKHERYSGNSYSKCEACKNELEIKDGYWEDLALRCIIQRNNEKVERDIKQKLGISKLKTIIEEPMELDEGKPIPTLQLEELPEESEELNEEIVQDVKEILRQNLELQQQLDQLKIINEDLEEQLKSKQEENQKINYELKEERERIEILTEELEKYSPIQVITWEKETSKFHCENCKETETHYEYCVPSTIQCYETLYLAERSEREEKEKEIQEYKDLWKIYEIQEDIKNEEKLIKEQQTFEEILAEFDKYINLENVC